MTTARATTANASRPTTGPVTTTDPVTPPATIKMMIVCLPDGTSPESLTTGFPNPLSTTAAPNACLWANGKPRFWQRRDLFGMRRGRKGFPTVCAGGPVRRLNLIGLRDAAGFHAGLRYQQWFNAVSGTRAAKPWHEFLGLHLADPSKLSLDAARKQFLAQARISAMRIFNEANYASPELDPYEVEMFQAGQQAYQSYHAMRAICGDAVQTPTGQRLQPDSDSLADRITYLGVAMRLLLSLPDRQRIMAVTL
jgi:hypothetical protein